MAEGSGSRRPSSGPVTVAAAAAVPAIVHPPGPSGVQPKNWLRPGVWITAARTAAEPTLLAMTVGLGPPVTRVWPSWLPTRAARATVRARVSRPVSLAAVHATVAAPAVVTARWVMSRVRA